MKLNSIKYIAIAGIVALTSCDDFLDKVPDNRVELSTPDQLTQLLVNAYNTYNYSTVCELSGDNYIDNNSPDKDGVRYNLAVSSIADLEAFCWEDIVSSVSQDSPSSIWQGCYHSIAVCNAVLERVAELEAEGRGDEVSAQKGEALVSRAYHHFILANIFSMPYAGDAASEAIPSVPYMTKSEDKVLVHYDRESLASVYRKIEADIVDGLPLIDDSNYEVPKYHFNKKAANAFAARFYLYKRDYEKAEAHATEALGGATGNPAGMMRQFWAKTFTTYNALVSAYCSAEEQSNLLIMPTYSSFSRSRGRFATNREAADATIFGKGPTWNIYNFHPCYSGKLFLAGSINYGVFFPKAGELFEYTDKVAGIGYIHIMRCEFTAEEAILTRAEARFYQGNIAGGMEDLRIWDKSRQNVSMAVSFPEFTEERLKTFYAEEAVEGIVQPLYIDEICPSDKYALTDDILPYIQCVLHFRRIETIDDGLRWFDIKRYGIEVTHKIGANRVEFLSKHDARRAIQVPAEVISAGFEPNIRVNLPAEEGKYSPVTTPYLTKK